MKSRLLHAGALLLTLTLLLSLCACQTAKYPVAEFDSSKTDALAKESFQLLTDGDYGIQSRVYYLSELGINEEYVFPLTEEFDCAVVHDAQSGQYLYLKLSKYNYSDGVQFGIMEAVPANELYAKSSLTKLFDSD